MSKHIHRFDSDETLTAITGITAIIDGLHGRYPFFVECRNQLMELKETLRASIAFHEQENLYKKSDAIDLLFNKSFVDLRSLAEVTGGIEGLGARGEACAAITSVIERHDWDLHEKPKKIQITLMNSVHKELDGDSENSIIDTADLRPIYKTLLKHHRDLEEVEGEKKVAAGIKSDIQNPSDVSKDVKRIINMLLRHMKDFQKLGRNDFDDTLQKIEIELAPLITQVKARITRAENADQ